MPTLEFKGKASVYSHHLSVPFRELIVEPEKSLPAAGKAPSLDDNLIIHGDNLEALKALLPRYAGKVDVIYIDPPYNTGSEGWRYNDNVNSPLMKQWLSKEVDKEDLERHDKWLCMMWPRLELLRTLLAPNGVLFVSIDDNEFGNLINVLTEIFGHDPIATIAVVNNMKGRNDKANFARAHEYLVVFGNGEFEAKGFALTDKQLKDFKYQDERGEKYAQRDLRRRGGADTRELRQRMYFPIYFDKLTGEASLSGSEDTHEIALPIKSDGQDGRWRWGKDKVEANLAIIRKSKSKVGTFGANYRIYLNPDAQVGELSDEEDLWDEDSGEPIERLSKSKSFWWGPELSTDSAIKSLKKIMAGSSEAFDYPKPAAMVGRILTTIGKADAIVLDSFAGSGTTAHAVLAANYEDKGNRKFVLIETEDYADTLTAERVRRVITGVPGAKDAALKKGLRGSFTFCRLGEPLDLERFFAGETTPSWEQVARYVVYTATGVSLEQTPKQPDDLWYVGEAGGFRIHLIYKPDLLWMKSDEAALSVELADNIAKAAKGKNALIYGAQKFMSQKALLPKGLTFCQLPYSIYRILGDGSDAA